MSSFFLSSADVGIGRSSIRIKASFELSTETTVSLVLLDCKEFTSLPNNHTWCVTGGRNDALSASCRIPVVAVSNSLFFQELALEKRVGSQFNFLCHYVAITILFKLPFMFKRSRDSVIFVSCGKQVKFSAK